jgi:hypothetical protein
VGPELAFFDPWGQKKVNDNILVPNAFTGTTQVLNSIHTPPYNPAPGTKAILRIVLLHGSKITTTDCNDPNPVSATPAEIESFANQLNDLSDKPGGFPKGTIVMFGNELNNLQKEYCYSTDKGHPEIAYDAGKDYAQLLKIFAAALDHGPDKKYLLAPTSIDPNNPDYSGKEFANGILEAKGYDVVDVLAQSVFDVAPAPDLAADIPPLMLPGEKLNLSTWRYFEKISGKKMVHFNGWGANPDNSSLRQQVDFYLNTPLPDGIESAATLIANTCPGHTGNAGSDWLFYIKGKVFDLDGNEIDPDPEKKCSKTLSSPHGLYIYPGIDDQKTFLDQVKMASTYMMTCANPYSFSGKIDNEDAITKKTDNTYVSYNLQCPGDPGSTNCLIPNVFGKLSINQAQTTIPLFRFDKAKVPNPDSPLRRYDDLEGFFGGKYAPLSKAENDQINQTLANGTTQKLSALSLQCSQTLEFLRSIKYACDNTPPNPAPLNSVTATHAGPTPPPTQATKNLCPLDLRTKTQTIDKTYTEILAMYDGLASNDQAAVCNQSTLPTNETQVNTVRSAITGRGCAGRGGLSAPRSGAGG